MTLTIHILLLFCALVCFVLATLGVAAKLNLTALGLAFLTAAFIFP